MSDTTTATETTTAVTVRINGEEREVPAGLTLAGLLAHLDLHPGMVVVERNRTIVRREAVDDVMVEAGDELELVHFVGGG